MKIATFNVNSIKARLPRVLEWLDDASPDVALLQELKTVDEQFPRFEIEEKGYNVEVHGQKSYNGVAILSKRPIEDVERTLPGDPSDEQARYIEGTIDGVRVASIYLPIPPRERSSTINSPGWTGLWRMSAIPCSHRKCPLFSAAITISVLLTTTCMTQSGSQMMRYADPSRAHGSEA